MILNNKNGENFQKIDPMPHTPSKMIVVPSQLRSPENDGALAGLKSKDAEF